MKNLTRKNNGKVNYENLVDLIFDLIKYEEAKCKHPKDILERMYLMLTDRLSISKDRRLNHINSKTISLLEKFDVEHANDVKIYGIARKFIEYNYETTAFRKIQDLFTLLEYWKNPIELQNLGINWKDIMSRKK